MEEQLSKDKNASDDEETFDIDDFIELDNDDVEEEKSSEETQNSKKSDRNKISFDSKKNQGDRVKKWDKNSIKNRIGKKKFSNNNDKPHTSKNESKYIERVWIPQDKYPSCRFVPFLLGVKGSKINSYENLFNVKISLRGQALDGKVKGRLISTGNDPDDKKKLHVIISSNNITNVKRASDKVRLEIEKLIIIETGGTQNTLEEDLRDTLNCRKNKNAVKEMIAVYADRLVSIFTILILFV